MTSWHGRSRLGTLRGMLPRGGALPESVWVARHRGICVLLWLHVGALALVGIFKSQSLAGSVVGLVFVAVCAAGATSRRLSRATRSSLATLGLLSCSALLIGYYEGLIEAHFHFFVTIAVVSLYQAWRPYLIAVGYVLLHHLVLGTLVPEWVYNHHLAVHHPWWFALIHSGALVAESVACLVFWRVTEDALDAERANGEALATANTDLSQANQAVADLVAMLSHDLRSPLTVLIGYSELARESWAEMSEAERLDFVDKVDLAGGSLLQLLDDTLTVSEIDAGGVAPRRAAVRVDDAVRDALAGLPQPWPTPDIDLLRPVTAEVDRGQLGQILTNLLTNAVKYGGGRFAVSTHEDEDTVLLRVSDSGAGVPVEFVPFLFDRFTRSDDARRGGQKGSGLGLYITRNLVAANAGTIRHSPTPGGGATFEVHLPRLQRAPTPVDEVPGGALV